MNVTVIRAVGAGVLVVLGVLVWTLLGPSAVESHDYESDIREVLFDQAANEANSDSAPQQQVVNGWATVDLLSIVTEQQNEALALHAEPLSDLRTPAFAGLLVLAAAFHLATSHLDRGPASKEEA
jgi:hypothetical protein